MFFTFLCAFSYSSFPPWPLYSVNDIVQYGLTTDPLAACGPSQRYQWPAEASRKNLQIWNLLKNVRGFVCHT